MGSGPKSGRRTHRRLIEICFVLVAFFATALVTAGVVAGQGPLAALSSASSGDTDTTATDPTEPAPTEPTDTETTSTDPTEPAPTEPEPEPSPADTEPPWPEATEPYLVKFASGTSAARQDEVLAAAGAVSQSYVRALRIHSVLLPGGDSLEASLEALDSFDEVARVEPNRTREVSGTPSDSRYGDQWALPKIGWDTVFGSVSPGGSARVAILDTGVDGSHPDLDGVVVPGTSILDGSNGLSDPNGHGTAMAGIVAAETDNGAGIAGVGYAGVQVMPVTVLGSDGTGQDGDIIEGVVYAAEAGADVILMAFSNPGYSELLQEAIDYAWDEGAVLIAAAGNDGSSTVTFPAGDRGVVGVSATDQSDALGGGSNSGQAVFLGAPGVDIATTSPGGSYGTVTGSSAAAAHVAGAAALVKAVSGASNGVIVGRLARTAEPAGSQGETGNGRLQLDRALADESTDSVQPAGADPVGSGGPYVGPYAVAANSFSGVAAPNSVAGGSTNNLVFTITATNSGNPGSSRNVTLTVPTGWTAPQTGAGAGQVNLGAGTCSVSNLTVTGMVISVTQPTGNGCTNGQTIIINYNQATAPTPTSPSQVYTFTLSPSGRSPTVTVTAPVGPTKLAFTTPALTGVYGQCLGPITVQTQNASNVATNVTSDTTVSLATNATGTFFGDSGCTTSVTSAVIPSGSNSGSFYYRPDGVGDGSHQLTASATGLTPASQTQTINKATLTVTASSPPDGTYGDPAPTITPQYAGFVLDDDADDLDTPPTCSTTYTQGAGPGTYPTSCSGGADDNYSFTYVNGSFVVAKKELTVTADNQTAQYSDPSPTLTFQYTGFVLGENPMVIDAPPTCSTTRTTESAPGEYPITCSSGADDNYSFAYVAGTFTVTQENASAIYTGDMLAFTAPGGSTASVLLRATVIDAPDGSPGNITNAKVAFKDNGTLLCSSLPVAPINSGDTTTGSAECTASLGVGDHTLTIEINGYYVGSGPGVVTVSQPDGSFITGGGYTVVQSSVGQHAADAGSRMNYGFNVKYNKSMKNLQGHVNIIFRKGGKTYQIKANAMESLGIAYRKADNTSCPGPPSATCFGLAEFRSKANLTDVTDPSAPVSLGGNLTLQMALTDKGEPGRDDEIAVTLWQGSTLLFSSNWNGAATVKQKIAGGNMVVH
jgi:hypothetical protein